MALFVDATTAEHARGIGTVIERLISEMSGDPRALIACGPSGAPSQATENIRIIHGARTRPGRLAYQRLLLPLDLAYLELRGHTFERVLLLDSYVPLVRWPGRHAYAVFVHDTLPLTHPYFWSRSQQRLKRAAFDSLRRARPVLFTSTDHNARQIFRLLGVEARVVRFGCGQLSDLEADVASRDPLPTRDAYFVAVGSFEPRKNLPLLISAFELVANRLPDFRLVLVGGGSAEYRNVLERRIANSPAADRIDVHTNLSAGDVLSRIARATAAAFPSLAEGFGLPIIEAMALGTPVVASDLAEIRSWAGDAVRYASPSNAADWVDPLLESVQVSDYLRRSAQQVVREYRWRTCAEALLAS
jgi:glycosyltransferase involved in cell wall biosynthesis